MGNFADAAVRLEDALDQAASRAEADMEPSEIIEEVKRWLHAYEQVN